MKTEEFSITKGQVEIYKIRHPSGMYWADITIDAKGTTGRIQIASDWGDYQYYWGACGVDFKDFLAKIGIDYAAVKFGASDGFNLDSTLKDYRRHVLDSRRRDQITCDEARDLYNEIDEMNDGPYGSIDHFLTVAHEKDKLPKFFSYDLSVQRDITPQFKKFWDTCWKVLLNEFINEKQTC
jgi:hypothetical protein